MQQTMRILYHRGVHEVPDGRAVLLEYVPTSEQLRCSKLQNFKSQNELRRAGLDRLQCIFRVGIHSLARCENEVIEDREGGVVICHGGSRQQLPCGCCLHLCQLPAAIAPSHTHTSGSFSICPGTASKVDVDCRGQQYRQSSTGARVHSWRMSSGDMSIQHPAAVMRLVSLVRGPGDSPG